VIDSFSALTPFVGSQQEYLASKNHAPTISECFYLEDLRGPGLTWSDIWKIGQLTNANSRHYFTFGIGAVA